MLIDLHLQSLFIAHVLTCLTLAASVGWVSRGDNSDGLLTWTYALCIYSCGFALLALRGIIADVFSIIVGNFLISLYYSMFLLTIRNFFSHSLNKFIFWLPPISIAIIYPFMMHSIRARIIFGNGILLVQSVLICSALFERRRSFPNRGRDLVLAIMLIGPPLLLFRIIVAIIKPVEVDEIFEASGVQVALGGLVYIGTILLSNGFVLMAKERSDERLRVVAMKDRLTGCWNRIRIDEFANQEMALLKRHGHPVSIIMIDIDHFKKINDQYGHAVGDSVLVEFADIVHQQIRSTDLLGRWGGEEFVIILPAIDSREAVFIAERIRNAIEQYPFHEAPHVTASFGLSGCLETDTWHKWLSRADRALYLAKANGRNQVQVG
jgi:diguanylate cyclase (GGDEF)-like protein